MPPRPLGSPLPYSAYDRRGYATVDVATGYAAWAGSYGELDDRLDLDLFRASPLLARRVRGASVVDLGCGTGRIGAWLTSAGASRVVGVDQSEAMLHHADARRVYAETRRGDVASTGLPEGSFDGATSSLVLCHVADLGSFFREAARLLSPGGWLAVVDFHPFFMMNGIPTHFDDPTTGDSIAITNHVHAMRDFFGGAQAAGLVAREMEERFVDEAWILASPNYQKHLGRPVTHFWAFERSA